MVTLKQIFNEEFLEWKRMGEYTLDEIVEECHSYCPTNSTPTCGSCRFKAFCYGIKQNTANLYPTFLNNDYIEQGLDKTNSINIMDKEDRRNLLEFLEDMKAFYTLGFRYISRDADKVNRAFVMVWKDRPVYSKEQEMWNGDENYQTNEEWAEICKKDKARGRSSIYIQANFLGANQEEIYYWVEPGGIYEIGKIIDKITSFFQEGEK